MDSHLCLWRKKVGLRNDVLGAGEWFECCPRGRGGERRCAGLFERDCLGFCATVQTFANLFSKNGTSNLLRFRSSQTI